MADESATDRDTIEQLADSFVTRFRAGERPSIEEFAGQYPELAEELRELLPALVLLEQNASPDDTAAFGGATTVAAPREIGDFAIVREIGRGGMGIVYEAVQQSLGRHVALKVLSSPGLLNPSHLERFRLEARAAARLHHTHIVPVFGVGEHGGLHYYAMQFIQGQSLDLVIDALRELRRCGRPQNTEPGGDTITRAVADGLLSGCFRADEPDAGCEGPSVGESPIPQIVGNSAELRPKPTTALSQTEFTSSHSGREFYLSVSRVALQVAEALAYAHSEGILHRDIKPSNLLLDARGNVWITDFGLAKSEGADGLTQTGDFVGTLRYMAPERLEGWSDRRSDLYSLGATLYELLTLRPFLESDRRGQLLDKILHESPPPPSRFDRLIPRDLETIVLKSIAKEPTARYRTAEEMAEDLRRFLADRPVLARRSTPSEQFIRWCRRNPAVAGLVAMVFTILIGGIAVSSYFAASASRQAQLAEVQGKRAESISAFFMDDVVGLADPERYDRAGITLVEALDSAAKEIDKRFPNDPDLRADVRDRLGQIYSGIDQPQEAVKQLEQAVELRRALLGERDYGTLKSRCNLGYALYQAGRYRESKEMLQDTLAVQCDILGAGHSDALETAGRLSITLMEMHDENDLKVAGETYRQALTSLGPQDYLTLDAQCTYAWVLRWHGELDKALELAKSAAIGLTNLKGEQDVRAMYATYNYASCLEELGRNEEAATVLRTLLTVRNRVLGPTHIDTLWTSLKLAVVSSEIGDAVQSQKLYEDLISKLNTRKNIPPSMMNGLAWTSAISPYARLRNGERAVALAIEACEATHYENSNFVDTLAAAHTEAGNADAVVNWSRKVLELEPTSVAFHYDAALRVLWSGKVDDYRDICALTAKHFDAATDENTRFWVVWTCGLGPASVDDLSVILTDAQNLVRKQPTNFSYRDALGILLYRHGDFVKARKLLTESVAAYRNDPKAPSSPLYSQFFLAMSHWQLDRLGDARSLLTEAQVAMDAEMKSPLAWNRRLTYELFRREAEALIQPAETAENASSSL